MNFTMYNTVRSGRIWLRGFLVLAVGFVLAPVVRAQPNMPVVHAGQPVIIYEQPVAQRLYSVHDCIMIGLERQPAIAAQQASLAAAEDQRRALDHMVFASLVSHELGFRKQQACLGITISQAGLEIAQWETIYAVTRCYYTVVYARQQETLAKALMDKLELSRKGAEAIVKRADPDSQVTQVDVDKLTVNMELVELRLIEASTGVSRATAALKEAMGVRFDTPLPILATELPIGDDNCRPAALPSSPSLKSVHRTPAVCCHSRRHSRQHRTFIRGLSRREPPTALIAPRRSASKCRAR
jgi:hypothetical protein